MKSKLLSIACCVVVNMGYQCAYAQQGVQRIHPSSPPVGGLSDMSATDAVVTDNLVLPLVGMSDHIEGRLAFVKTELKITAAQMTLWDAFATASRVNAARENELIARESSDLTSDGAAPALPQRLQAHENHLIAHLKMLKAISAALLPLYASLSDTQKKTAEALAGGAVGL